MPALFASTYFWLVPLGIFFAEMVVVTLGTMRIIFVSQGRRYLAPCLGFFEVLIWLFAIAQIMQNLNQPSCFLGFALGFTIGNYVGIRLEKVLAMGKVNVRIITKDDPTALVEKLRSDNFGVTQLDGKGGRGPVHVIMTIIPRRQLPEVVDLIRNLLPSAFYAVDDVQEAGAGIFPLPASRALGFLPAGVKLFAWTGSMLSTVLAQASAAAPVAKEMAKRFQER